MVAGGEPQLFVKISEVPSRCVVFLYLGGGKILRKLWHC